jgi:hypothetical protein
MLTCRTRTRETLTGEIVMRELLTRAVQNRVQTRGETRT